jgi:hypothetical protein
MQDYPDTYYGQATTETRLQSDTADNVIWAKYAQLPRRNRKDSLLAAPTDALSSKSSSKSSFESRVEFKEIGSHVPLLTAINEAKAYAERSSQEDHGGDKDGDAVQSGDVEPNSEKYSNGDEIQEAELIRTRSKSSRKSGDKPRAKNMGRLIVVTGRSRRLAVEDHRRELGELLDEYGQLGPEVRKALGDVASGFVATGIASGIVVLQAAAGASID